MLLARNLFDHLRSRKLETFESIDQVLSSAFSKEDRCMSRSSLYWIWIWIVILLSSRLGKKYQWKNCRNMWWSTFSGWIRPFRRKRVCAKLSGVFDLHWNWNPHWIIIAFFGVSFYWQVICHDRCFEATRGCVFETMAHPLHSGEWAARPDRTGTLAHHRNWLEGEPDFFKAKCLNNMFLDGNFRICTYHCATWWWCRGALPYASERKCCFLFCFESKVLGRQQLGGDWEAKYQFHAGGSRMQTTLRSQSWGYNTRASGFTPTSSSVYGEGLE